MTPAQLKQQRRIWRVLAILCIVFGTISIVFGFLDNRSLSAIVGVALVALGVFNLWFFRRRFK